MVHIDKRRVLIGLSGHTLNARQTEVDENMPQDPSDPVELASQNFRVSETGKT